VGLVVAAADTQVGMDGIQEHLVWTNEVAIVPDMGAAHMFLIADPVLRW
jgi:hypothetical protein